MSEIRVAELFAGVGGFRLGLEGYTDPENPEFNLPAAGPFTTVWANQWEPPGTERRQFAARCYEQRFGPGSVVNDDINRVLDFYEAREIEIPDVDMVVGGFPCQDYSVAKPLSQSGGIEGHKGVLWWDIYRFLRLKNCPRYVLLENVDRLLKSPTSQRGRDFAIMLACFASLGYSVEWRVVNSAKYGFSQRRKRVYIFAERGVQWDLETQYLAGIMASALPIEAVDADNTFTIPSDSYEITQTFNVGGKKSPFLDGGLMQDLTVRTFSFEERFEGHGQTLGDVLIDESSVPESYYVPESQLERWKYLKGSKREPRVNKTTGHEYFYSEGSMAFPDLLENPSRTILTGEGGSGPSRFKHIIHRNGKWRRLVPEELERLQGFPAGWTDTGMTAANRAFCMGNALVVGIPHLIGKQIALYDESRVEPDGLAWHGPRA